LNNAPNPASTSAKKVAVLTLPVVTTATTPVAVTALNSVLLQRTLGTKATAALPHVKTRAKTAHVKVAAGKSVVVTTAMQLGPPPAALRVQVTSSPAAPSSLVPATSNRTPQAKALQSAAVHAC
jgi:hypothetical protein